jgi:hypothetical protein
MANEISTSLTMTEMVEDVCDPKANINVVTPIEFETQIRIDALEYLACAHCGR